MIINQSNIYTQNQINSVNHINSLVQNIGKQTFLADQSRNYTWFNFGLVDRIVKYKEAAIPAVINVLSTTQDEKVIVEGLYVLDRMIEAGVKGIDKHYYVISRFNNTSSPDIQVLLSGIYRKTQIPDAFGPLCKMLIKDSLKPNNPYFDPTEEIGGAILEYLRNKSAVNQYKSITSNK